MKKYFLTLIACLSAMAVAIAQNNMGIDYFLSGEISRAKEFFENQTSGNPGQANFYLGEIALAEGKADAAKSYYEKGLAAAPGFALNKVGLAKLLLKSNPSEGSKQLAALAKDKNNRKDPEVIYAIAKTYRDNGMTDEMNKIINNSSYKSDLIYILRGDIYKDANNIGKAAAEYEQAIMKNPNFVVPYVKVAMIYMHINPRAAVDKLNELWSTGSNHPLVAKFLAKAYYNMGAYDRANEIFKSFFNINTASVEDITDYAASLFFVEQYGESAALVDKGIVKDPDNFVLNRLRMYSAFETNDYDAGIKTGEKFFSLPLKENKYIARDYLTYAALLIFEKQPDKALEMYNYALELSEEKTPVYKQIGETLNKAGYPEKGAEYYEKYIAGLEENADAAEYFTLGQMFYRAATTALQDTANINAAAEAEVFMSKGDKTFAVVAERSPDNYLGPIFRARINSLRDPDASRGLAKPYYEQALNILLSKEDALSKNKREILEIYRYLSYYHYVQFDLNGKPEDKAQAIEISKKMLELDPANSVAVQLLEALQ